jgi:Predicted permease, DMT superfamily
MRTALLKLHLAILLAGFTGIFGKWISLTEVPLVWWRLLLVIAVLYPLLRLRGAYRRPPFRQLLTVYGIGGLQALHWVLFYGSIKASTVSVALVCLSVMGFFTALLSPPILGTKWSVREFVYSGITIVGVGLIFHFDTHYRLGIAIGFVSSIVAALFVICNKKVVDKVDDPSLLFHHEVCGGFILITLFLPLFTHLAPTARFLPTSEDLLFLIILAVACTVVMYVLEFQALKWISAFTVNLSFNLEPVYSIILAALLLGEGKTFTRSFYLGLELIILSVGLQTLHVLRRRDRGTRSIQNPASQRHNRASVRL